MSHVQVNTDELLKNSAKQFNYYFSCSLACFKTHKENEKCQQIVPRESEVIEEDRKPSNINVFTTVDTVPLEKLQELEKSETIKNMLKNPHLRNFLLEINSATNSWNAMKIAMLEPIFLEFADACLNIVEPQTPADEIH